MHLEVSAGFNDVDFPNSREYHTNGYKDRSRPRHIYVELIYSIGNVHVELTQWFAGGRVQDFPP